MHNKLQLQCFLDYNSYCSEINGKTLQEIHVRRTINQKKTRCLLIKCQAPNKTLLDIWCSRCEEDEAHDFAKHVDRESTPKDSRK